MTNNDFQRNVEERCKKIKATLNKKAEIYASDRDRLHSLIAGAKLNGITPQEYCVILQTKHEIVLQDMIENDKKGFSPTVELLDEIIGDMINYLILIENLFLAKIEAEEGTH
jgi:hypothetical protein